MILDFITTRLTTLEARLRESRRESSELDATGSNLASSFQPVFTGSNRFLTKLFSGKTSLINSLAYMIKKKDGETAWRAAASYDLGKKYKFKVNYYQIFTILWFLRSSNFTILFQSVPIWPEHRGQKTPRVTFYEAGGFSQIKEVEKAATLLQYTMEGRFQEGRITGLLQLVSIWKRLNFCDPSQNKESGYHR